jgi:hypothetical protein
LKVWGPQVKGLFVAVPQIEHNWTANDRHPENLRGFGATNLSRAGERPKNNGPRNKGLRIEVQETVTKE